MPEGEDISRLAQAVSMSRLAGVLAQDPSGERGRRNRGASPRVCEAVFVVRGTPAVFAVLAIERTRSMAAEAVEDFHRLGRQAVLYPGADDSPASAHALSEH